VVRKSTKLEELPDTEEEVKERLLKEVEEKFPYIPSGALLCDDGGEKDDPDEEERSRPTTPHSSFHQVYKLRVGAAAKLPHYCFLKVFCR
jgi:hypothetical protein